MIYRDDQEALQQRLDGTSREAERLRKENDAMRAAVGRLQVTNPGSTLALPPGAVYALLDVRTLPLEERARLAAHAIRPFPVWLVGLLNVLTFGLFPLIHFGLLHDKLPRASHNDPGSGKAIGYQFIPYYNLYWIFFSALRLCDRLSLQLKLRGLAERAPRGLVLAACVVTMVPYVNLLIALPVLWTIAVCMLQSTVNRVASLSPQEWDATLAILPPGYAGNPAYPANQAYPGNLGYFANPVANPAATQPDPANPAYPANPVYSANPANPAYPVDPANLAYPASQAYPGYLGAMAMYQPSPEQLARQARARRLVNWSHVLGWGGLGMLIVGTIAAGVAAGPAGAVVVGVASTISMVVGAIIGQVGRGMQGRAI